MKSVTNPDQVCCYMVFASSAIWISISSILSITKSVHILLTWLYTFRLKMPHQQNWERIRLTS